MRNLKKIPKRSTIAQPLKPVQGHQITSNPSKFNTNLSIWFSKQINCLIYIWSQQCPRLNKLLKGYDKYIFAMLFFKSKRKHFWNYENVFISLQKHFSFFRYSKLEYQNLKFNDVIKWVSMKQEIHAHQGVNVSFLENFAYLLNGWPDF